MKRLGMMVILGCLMSLPLCASEIIHWEKSKNAVVFTQAEGLLKIQVCKDDLFRVLFFPAGSKVSEVKSESVIKYDWAPVAWKVIKQGKQILIKTRSNIVRVDCTLGTLSFEDVTGNVLLAETKTEGHKLIAANVLEEQTFHAEQSFVSPADESIYGLGQFQEGIMDFKDYYLKLRQFNTVIALPFYFSNKGYGLFWNNSSLTEFNPEKKELPHSIQASWDYHWTLFEPTESGEHVFILDGLNNNASVVMTIDELSMVNGFEERKRCQVINQDYDVIPVTLAGRVYLEKGKKYELNYKANFDKIYVKTPAMMGKSVLHSEVADVIDYYFFAGTADHAIAGLRDLTGRAPMFPKWAYGFTQSRFTYDSQQAMLNVAKQYRERKYPVDIIVQDMNYWEVNDERNTWGSHLFDAKKFPDPQEMYKELHDKYHVHTLISVWPRINKDADLFDYFVKNGYSLGIQSTKNKNKEGFTIVGEQNNIAIDPYNPEARKAYWRFMKERLWDKGVDGWWLDANEPEWGYDFRHSNTFAGTGARNLNTYSLMQTKAIYDGQRELTSDKRVVILTRSAFSGQQRYATQCWSGDIGITWNTYEQQIAAGLNYSMAGMPYWSCDIGGFRPDMKTHSHAYRELVTRWYQFGTFLPILRVHGCRATELWNLTKSEEDIQVAYDSFRYRLLPYIYSLAARVTKEHYTIYRGLAMDFPKDEKVKRITDQFMMGDAFLVNPITEYRARSRELYLPKGKQWYNFWTGERQEGGQFVTTSAPIEQIPLFVPAGTILPLGEVMQYATEKPAEVIELRIYTGENASFVLYEDENDNYNYEKGQYSEIPITWNEGKQQLTIGKLKGGFPGYLKERKFHVVFVSEGQHVGLEPSIVCDKEIVYKNQKIVYFK